MKEKARKVLIIALCLVAVVCAGYLIWYYAMAGKVNDSYDKAKKTAEIPKESPIVSEDGNKADIPIDFSALQEANPEVYAWIRIEDTNIDYPILQSAEDDNYYLDHTWKESALRRVQYLHKAAIAQTSRILILSSMGIRWGKETIPCSIIWGIIWMKGIWKNIPRS